MKSFWFHLLILFGVTIIGSCGGGLCNCKGSCKVTPAGQVSCSLNEKAFEKRKAMFHKTFVSKATKVEETASGLYFEFPDEGKINTTLFKFIIEEKKCCPFFQYDIKVLANQGGIQLSVSGNEEVKAFLKTLVSVEEEI
ncbi:MAG: hypothetical protein AAF502_20995 [Bacteroidota bacterium]